MENKISINLLPNYFVEDNKFKKDEAISLGGKIAGICYSKSGFLSLLDEDEAKTQRRVNMTLNNGHHSVYDHLYISMNIVNIPRILAMVLNNEKEYTTSEKSFRYTSINEKMVSKEEFDLYNKWMDIFTKKISDRYSDVFDDKKIKKLAQENARYFISIFTPSEMIYTTSLRQINYIASWFNKYINENINSKDDFKVKLAFAMKNFVNELDSKNLLEENLMKNEKSRSISLFNENIDNKKEIFCDIYQTKYLSSFACLAQNQRHRTLNYQIKLNKEKSFYVPPIISDDNNLVNEYLCDMKSVEHLYVQGENILVLEQGNYEDFILKCKERLCSCAQVEINDLTHFTLTKYLNTLKANNDPLYEDIVKYSHGARCTFPDYKCNEDCHFKEGKTLVRKI